LITLTADFTLMAPFGGPPSRGGNLPDERWAEIGRFFRHGTLSTLELVQAYRAADMVVLVAIERGHVEVGEVPAQDWALRVTLVFRREQGQWRLAHRHADPLAHAISVAQSAALARGDVAQAA
jgi:ketosteroid isomerase-like protein